MQKPVEPWISPPEGLLFALLRDMADAVYLVDEEGRVLFANPAALHVLGLASAEDIVGRDSHAAIHHTRPNGEPFPEHECPLLAARDAGSPLRVELDWFIRGDGSFVPVSYSSAPIELADGRGAAVVFQDVTQRLVAEHHAEEVTAERARAEEIAASRRRIVDAEDRLRARLERDLHDGGQQVLVRQLVRLQQARRALGPDAGDAAKHLDEAIEDSREASRQLRALASGLDPVELRAGGLVAALYDMTARSPVPVGLHVTDQRFDRATERTAYFVIAEAVANALKHATPTQIEIEVEAVGGDLLIEVRDDGSGIAHPPPTGTGLVGLEDRLAAVGGRLDLERRPGGGTVVRARLPR